jgi:hypothetical protein
VQETLFQFHVCEDYVRAETARHFAPQKVNICWIPHTIDDNQKAERIAFSSELLEVPMNQGRNEFDHIIT